MTAGRTQFGQDAAPDANAGRAPNRAHGSTPARHCAPAAPTTPHAATSQGHRGRTGSGTHPTRRPADQHPDGPATRTPAQNTTHRTPPSTRCTSHTRAHRRPSTIPAAQRRPAASRPVTPQGAIHIDVFAPHPPPVGREALIANTVKPALSRQTSNHTQPPLIPLTQRLPIGGRTLIPNTVEQPPPARISRTRTHIRRPQSTSPTPRPWCAATSASPPPYADAPHPYPHRPRQA